MSHRYQAHEYGKGWHVYKVDARGHSKKVAEFTSLESLNEFMDALATHRGQQKIGLDGKRYKPGTFRRYVEEAMQVLKKV